MYHHVLETIFVAESSHGEVFVIIVLFWHRDAWLSSFVMCEGCGSVRFGEPESA